MSAVQGVDEELAKYYKNNLTMLAAAKTATITNRLIAACKQSKDRDEYNKLAKQIINTYNRYTAAEYNTMVHRVRVAKQFEQFQQEKQLYPNIEWLPSRAANPDIVHRGYWYHIWVADDPFWTDNFPGCRWGCKCSWRTTDASVTDKSNVKLIPPSPGLDGNPYFTKEIISKSHSYYRDIEKHIPKLGVLHNPDDVVYISFVKNNTVFKVHYLAINEYEKMNKLFIDYVINAGFKDIRLLPVIEYKYEPIRNRYFGKYAANGCPDAFADGKFVEFKLVNPGKKIKRNVKDAITKALNKADVVFVKIKGWLNSEEINIKGSSMAKKFREKTIYLIDQDDKIHTFN